MDATPSSSKSTVNLSAFRIPIYSTHPYLHLRESRPPSHATPRPELAVTSLTLQGRCGMKKGNELLTCHSGAVGQAESTNLPVSQRRAPPSYKPPTKELRLPLFMAARWRGRPLDLPLWSSKNQLTSANIKKLLFMKRAVEQNTQTSCHRDNQSQSHLPKSTFTRQGRGRKQQCGRGGHIIRYTCSNGAKCRWLVIVKWCV